MFCSNCSMYKRQAKKPKKNKTRATTTIVQQFVCLRETLAFSLSKDTFGRNIKIASFENSHVDEEVSCGCELEYQTLKHRNVMKYVCIGLGATLYMECPHHPTTCFCEERSCPACSNPTVECPSKEHFGTCRLHPHCFNCGTLLGLCAWWGLCYCEWCLARDELAEVWRAKAWTIISCRWF